MKKLVNWLILILWLWFIWFAASQPGLASGLGVNEDTLARKAIHFLIYFALAYWWWRILQQHQIKNALGWALVLTILYAASDEYHQIFVSGREGTPVDWGIDTMGALLFSFIQWRNLNPILFRIK